MEKISAVYKIVNELTGDTYVGSSKDVKHRWACHKVPSTWKEHPNSLLYKDMQKYGVDKFRLQILVPVMPEYLTQVEQEFIELLKPTYNNYRAKGVDVERHKESNREYSKSDKNKKWIRKYRQSDKGKEVNRKAQRKYQHQLCCYNGETLTFGALLGRFRRAGIENPAIEAKKYLIES